MYCIHILQTFYRFATMTTVVVVVVITDVRLTDVLLLWKRM